MTDRAQQLMALARKEAARLQHDFIGTEHLLLGLIQEGNGVAANVLNNLGVKPERIQSEIEANIQKGTASVSKVFLPLTPRAKNALEFSMDEARNLGHSYIGTEHLLLGLLRENDGVAALVLRELGLKLEVTRKKVRELLGEDMTSAVTPPAAPKAAHLLQRLWRRLRSWLSGESPGS